MEFGDISHLAAFAARRAGSRTPDTVTYVTPAAAAALGERLQVDPGRTGTTSVANLGPQKTLWAEAEVYRRFAAFLETPRSGSIH